MTAISGDIADADAFEAAMRDARGPDPSPLAQFPDAVLSARRISAPNPDGDAPREAS